MLWGRGNLGNSLTSWQLWYLETLLFDRGNLAALGDLLLCRGDLAALGDLLCVLGDLFAFFTMCSEVPWEWLLAWSGDLLDFLLYPWGTLGRWWLNSFWRLEESCLLRWLLGFWGLWHCRFSSYCSCGFSFFLFFFLLVLGGVTGNRSSVDGCFIRSYTLCRSRLVGRGEHSKHVEVTIDRVCFVTCFWEGWIAFIGLFTGDVCTELSGADEVDTGGFEAWRFFGERDFRLGGGVGVGLVASCVRDSLLTLSWERTRTSSDTKSMGISVVNDWDTCSFSLIQSFCFGFMILLFVSFVLQFNSFCDFYMWFFFWQWLHLYNTLHLVRLHKNLWFH